MAKVHKSELNCSQIQSLLDSDVQETQKLIEAINSFVNESTTTLTGDAYNTARSEMASYISILNERMKAANALKESLSSSTSSLSSYMGEYDYLDDADISIIESEIDSIVASYESMKAGWWSRHKNNFITRFIYNIKASSLDRQCASQIAPLKKELEKLKGLAGADASAYSKLVTAEQSNTTYKSAITSR